MAAIAAAFLFLLAFIFYLAEASFGRLDAFALVCAGLFFLALANMGNGLLARFRR